VSDSWTAISLAEREGKLHRLVFPVAEPFKMHWAPDLHYPFQNQDVVDYIIDISRGCDLIGQIGDGLEAYGVAKYTKNPLVQHTLQDEARLYRNGFWKPIRKQNPTARLVQVHGNHEDRIANYLWSQAPALHDTPGLKLSRLIHAKRLGIEVVPRSGIKVAGYRVKHGDVARAIGSARSEMTHHRWNGISAHTHRCEHETLVDAEGHQTDWYSIGHATRPELLDYLKGKTPNWHLSAGVTVTVYPDGRTEVVEHRL